MRIDRPQERTFGRVLGGVVVLAAAGLGAAAGGTTAALAGGVLGLAAALVLARAERRRERRRRALLRPPFPRPWREVLRTQYDHYCRLPEDWRGRFEDDLRIFLSEKRITGIEVAVTEELRLLVGSSAVTLSVGWPDYEWDQLAEVLLYPQDFDRDYTFGKDDLAGQTHPWGTVILSVPALRESFEDPSDGYHVGIHEFAHLLDVDQTRFDGIPVGLDEARSRRWVEIREKEMERLRRGKSALDPYGAHDPVEFLAVAVEAFFETPLALRDRHRELYAMLCSYFAQDPAAWDDARGLLG
ncbi:MAG TPA: M90 family metallopeptidase [Vicinamibacteria bacterium]|nr:M90 family metallopeptidase [Vicinamibacteria bacterium]